MHIMVGQGRRFTGLQQGRDLSSQSGTLNEACTTQDMDIPAINKHNIVTNCKIHVLIFDDLIILIPLVVRGC